MFTTPLIVLIIGLAIGFLSFGYAAFNMASMQKNMDKNPSKFSSGFGKHVGAMIGMALGSVVAFVGLVLLLLPVLQKFTEG